MKQAVMAILDHCSSTDDDHHHDNCPPGEGSWCFYQRAKVKGLPPASHADSVGTPICKLVADHIRPAFERMSSDDLLSRCIRQSTQNANESAHAVISTRCPKHQFVNRNQPLPCCCLWSGRVQLRCNILLGFSPDPQPTRTRKAQAAVTEKARRYRQLKAEARQREEQKLIDNYGEFYVSGGRRLSLEVRSAIFLWGVGKGFCFQSMV